MRRVNVKDLFREQRAFELRAIVAGVVAATLLAIVAARVISVHVVRHDYYTDLSQGNRARIVPLPPVRGVIYDRHGRVLAENTPAYQLTITREQVPDLEATLAKLVGFGLLEREDLPRVRQLLQTRRLFEAVPVRLSLDDEEIGRYAVHRHELAGVDLATRMERFYPYGPVGVHALGYVGTISEDDLKRVDLKDYFGTAAIGKTGLERSYETDLHGSGGFREVLVNAEGRSVETLGGECFGTWQSGQVARTPVRLV